MKMWKRWIAAIGMLCGCGAGAAETAAPADISRIDPNFAQEKIGDLPVCFVNVLDTAPFDLTGFPWRKPGGPLLRLPEELVNEPSPVNSGARYLAWHTSGGAIRFRTDSRYIALRADLSASPRDMDHMPRTGSSGFDIHLLRDGRWLFRSGAGPGPGELKKGRRFEAMLGRPWEKRAMREYILNLPLYNSVSKLELGFEPGAKIEAPTPWRIPKPILFYGSSITQGGCASRPGNQYSTLLCRELDAPQINLGFSGSGKGEPAIAEAIAKLDLAAFVMDYDHNAPDAEYLQMTHERFFKIVRQAHPELPILILSGNLSPERTKIIKQTYENAVAAGDKHVYFIDGATFFADFPDRNQPTVDGTHPTDLGFYFMYRTVLPVLKEALGLR